MPFNFKLDFKSLLFLNLVLICSFAPQLLKYCIHKMGLKRYLTCFSQSVEK